MPRACPVESHVRCYLAGNVNPPRHKAVASSFAGGKNGCSVQRETPRDKPVASSTFEEKPAGRADLLVSFLHAEIIVTLRDIASFFSEAFQSELIISGFHEVRFESDFKRVLRLRLKIFSHPDDSIAGS